jgi:hypothetical protein
MALTPEQQAQVELSEMLEASRFAHQLEVQNAVARLDAVRLAKETLIENARNKPVSERDISPEDITAFANTLVAYIVK